MSNIEWGPEIAVNGVTEPDVVGGVSNSPWQYRAGDSAWIDRGYGQGCMAWETIDFFRLPADHPHYAAPAVDWSKPIEAVHEDGRGVPVAVLQAGGETMRIDPDSLGDGAWCFRSKDGTHRVDEVPWRIRNVGDPAAHDQDAVRYMGFTAGETTTKPIRTAAEMLDRLEALARRLALQTHYVGVAEVAEARAIVAEMTPPVDPDVAIANALVGPFDIWGSYTAHHHAEKLALSALKRGRELALG